MISKKVIYFEFNMLFVVISVYFRIFLQKPPLFIDSRPPVEEFSA